MLQVGTDNSIETKRYIGGYAIESRYSTGTKNLHYLHKNHIGSLDAITNEAALIIETVSFSAFGQRRAADNLNVIVEAHSAISLQGLLGITKRGFTGHEHIDSANLIHMNGRIYDPVLARFIQADPIIQAPKNTQNLNRYSYIVNNPLAGTDPSGYSFDLLNPMKHVMRSILGKFSHSGGQALVAIGSMFCGPAAAACAAYGSYQNARAHGYSRGSALQAGVYAGVSAGVFQIIGSAYSNTNLGCTSCYNSAGKLTGSALAGKTLTHAIAGGVLSDLQGGSFGHAFLAAGVTQAMSPQIDLIYEGRGGIYKAARVLAAGIVGGSTSKLTGGKFANGAITAAFSRAFNDEGHNKQEERDEKIEALTKRIRDSYDNDPEKLIPLSSMDMALIIEEASAEANSYPLGNPLTARGRSVIGSQFEDFDTLLYRFTGAKFSFNGGVHIAGNLNYVGVGVLMARYRAYPLVFNAVGGWNVYQYFTEGYKVYNIKQIPSATRWAIYGMQHYDSGVQ